MCVPSHDELPSTAFLRIAFGWLERSERANVAINSDSEDGRPDHSRDRPSPSNGCCPVDCKRVGGAREGVSVGNPQESPRDTCRGRGEIRSAAGNSIGRRAVAWRPSVPCIARDNNSVTAPSSMTKPIRLVTIISAKTPGKSTIIRLEPPCRFRLALRATSRSGTERCVAFSLRADGDPHHPPFAFRVGHLLSERT